MTARPVLKPSASHPITITPTSGRVTVTLGTEVVAQTDNALTLRESTYPAVQYIPLEDVDPVVLRRSDTTTYCPFKGDAGYYSVLTSAGETITDAVWTYERPHEEVAAIAGHVAFYPDKANIIVGG